MTSIWWNRNALKHHDLLLTSYLTNQIYSLSSVSEKIYCKEISCTCFQWNHYYIIHNLKYNVSALLIELRIHWLHPLERSKAPPKKGVSCMTLNCICWWGSISGALGSVKYPSVVITSMFSLIQNVGTYKGSNRSVTKLFILDRNTWYHV